jgi:hypothetical protein
MASLEQINEKNLVRFSAAKLELNDSQLAHLKKFKRLVSINLDDTVITDKSLPLIGSFPNLIMLRVNGTDITGSGFPALVNLHALLTLNIGGINLKPGSLACLKPLGTHITEVICTRAGLTAVDLESIGQMKNIDTLALDGNKAIGNDCVKLLLPLKKLQKLNIMDTSITEKSLPELYKLPSLAVVKIRKNQFWSGGVAKKTKAGIIFEDYEANTRVPIDMFSPLH